MSNPSERSVTVQRWHQYKLGRAPFEHDPRHDQHFDNQKLADEFLKTADSGFGGDMRYDYRTVPGPQKTNPSVIATDLRLIAAAKAGNKGVVFVLLSTQTPESQLLPSSKMHALENAAKYPEIVSMLLKHCATGELADSLKHIDPSTQGKLMQTVAEELANRKAKKLLKNQPCLEI